MRRRADFGRGRQRGVAAVEFAIVAIVFFVLIFAIVDFGRWLFAMNAAAEATRLGARLAVVCNIDSATPKNCMRKMLPGLTDAQVAISYAPAGCTTATCASASVQINGMTIDRVFPVPDFTMPIGSFPTRLTRESLATSWVCDCP